MLGKTKKMRIELKRRSFVKFISVATFVTALDGLNSRATTELEDNQPVCTFPQPLDVGDTIAMTAVASPCSLWEVQPMVNFFKKKGISVVIGKTITNRDKNYRYLSNNDEFRANEFMDFVHDPKIKAIVSARGGYGSIRILEYLDFEAIKLSHKIFLGYSDFTCVLNAIHKLTNIVTFHGPLGNFYPDNYTAESLSRLIFRKSIVSNINQRHRFSRDSIIAGGKARGNLVGGNLTSLVSLLGTKYEIDTTDKILFFEEIDEHPYKIDRMLKQLELAGKFENCRGIIIGYIGKLDAKRNFFPDYSFTTRQVLEMNLGKLGIPVVINLPFGHNKRFMTLPLGIEGVLDTESQEFLLILPEAVSKL